MIRDDDKDGTDTELFDRIHLERDGILMDHPDNHYRYGAEIGVSRCGAVVHQVTSLTGMT